MAKFETSETETDFAAEPTGLGADDFAFETEKAPVSRSAMVLVFLFILGGGGLYFLYTQSSFAQAGDLVAVSTAESAGANSQISEMRRGLAETRRIVSIFEQISARPYVPLKQLAGNPFSSITTPRVVAEVAGTKVPEMTEKERLFMQATAELAQLKVSSLMDAGPDSTVSINRRLLRIGQKIKAEGGTTEFTLLRVESAIVDGRSQVRAILGAYDQEFILMRK